MYTTWKGSKNRVESTFGSCNFINICAHKCLLKVGYLRQFWSFKVILTDFCKFGGALWAQILTKLHEPKMDSTLLFDPFQVVFCCKKASNMLVFCSIHCRDNIYDISFGKFLTSDLRLNKPNFYVYNLFGVILCWFEWEQAVSVCFHTFDQDK